MKRFNRVVSFLLMLSFLLLMTTACKKNQSDKEGSDVTDTSNTEPTVAEAQEITPAVTIKLEQNVYDKPKDNVQYEETLFDDFEGDTTFTKVTDAGIEVVADDADANNKCLYIHNRSNTFDGASLDLSGKVLNSTLYHVSAKVKYTEGEATDSISIKYISNGEEAKPVKTFTVNKGEWTYVEATTYVPGAATSFGLTFVSDTVDLNFYIDDVCVEKQTVDVKVQDIPSLKEYYTDYFSIGAVLGSSGLSNDNLKELVKKHCNSLTLENELKPDAVLDYNACITAPIDNECPSIDMSKATAGFEFCKENGIKMRGHVLVWHSQTPAWFFRENYAQSANSPYVSREVMLKRMENYIRQVLEYCQTNYPGIIYCWDVVNEAVNVGEGEPNGLRNESSLWYQVVGPDFIEKAFEYARKYADPDVKLFYNDYGTEESAKMNAIKNILEPIYAQGNIDGIGLQSHISVDSPSIMTLDKSIRTYAKIGLEIQITELDVDMQSNTKEDLQKQAKRYKMLFLYFMKWKDEDINISNVTLWGTTDDRSWLNTGGKVSYPLLFDKYLSAKPAFWGVLQDADISLY